MFFFFFFKADYVIGISTNALIRGILSTDVRVSLCSLQLLFAILSTGGQSQLLQHQHDGRQQLLSEDDLTLQLTTGQLRLSLLHLQQCLLKVGIVTVYVTSLL